MFDKPYYHCKRSVTDDGIVEYSAPILKKGNYQPLSGYVDALTYGDAMTTKWRMFVPMRRFGEFKERDLLYLDGATPDIEREGYENGDGANATVTAVLPQNLFIRIEIERIVKKGA